MIWQTLEVQLLRFCGSAMTFAVNWFVQSTLLMSAGLLVAWLFRTRGSAFQSVVYRTTLCAVLLGPVVSLAMAFCGLEGWSMKLPQTFALNHADVTIESLPSHDQTIRLPQESDVAFDRSAPIPLAVPPQAERDVGSASGIGSVQSSGSVPDEQKIRQPTTASPALQRENRIDKLSMNPSAQPPTLKIHAFGMIAIVLSILWVVIAAARTICLAVIMIRMDRLRRRAITASPEEIVVCQRIAAELKLDTPQVLRAPFLTSPCLHGIRRPAVMLPEEVTIPLQEIFVHELAHLRRRDCLWMLLHQIAASLLFFQPLLVKLGRRMDATAEEVCDDFVVQFGGNRESYATSLIDLASLSTAPIAIAGVGMVSLRSLLGQRVGRIMDTSRSLTTRVGKFSMVLVLSGALTAVLIGGFVGLSPNTLVTAQVPPEPETQKESEPEVVEQESSKPNASSNKSTQTSIENFTGRVTDHNGKAVAGAKLLWYRTRVHDLDPMLPKLVAETDKDGKYSFPPPAIPDPATELGSWGFNERIAIVAPGHGFRIVVPQALKQQKSTSFLGAIAGALSGANDEASRLPAEGKPIHGRVVSIEGTPVAGATVRIRNFAPRKAVHYQQSDLEARGSKEAYWQSWLSNLLMVIEPVPERFALPSATTDADGKFELASVPEDCLFQLLLEGEGIQATDIIAHNETGEKKVVKLDNLPDPAPTTIHRNDFLFAAAPSRPVVGRITDLDTGEPVPNAIVRAFTVHGEVLSSTRERQHFATRTDKEGRYQISGLPLGNGNRLAAFSSGDIPYFPAGQTIDTSKTEGTVEANFKLKKTVWATGRVIDGATGKPFTGEMTYYWFRDRALETAMPGLREYNTDGLYYTNANGEFRIPVLPTRGILAYRWDGNGFQQPNPIDRYARGLGADKIEGKEDAMNAFPTMPYYLMAGNYNFVSEIKPQLGDEQVKVEMVLQESKPVQLKFVGKDGEKIPNSGYQVYGLNERWGWQVTQTTEPVVEDRLPNQTRKVFVFHPEAGLAGGVIVDENSKQPVEITLNKSGKVTGRLIDKSGEIIADGRFRGL